MNTTYYIRMKNKEWRKCSENEFYDRNIVKRTIDGKSDCFLFGFIHGTYYDDNDSHGLDGKCFHWKDNVLL